MQAGQQGENNDLFLQPQNTLPQETPEIQMNINTSTKRVTTFDKHRTKHATEMAQSTLMGKNNHVHSSTYNYDRS